MSGFLLVPVDDDWMEEFNRTVKNTVSISDPKAPDELREQGDVRIWGTTNEEKKRPYFEKAETGDPVLFYNDGQYFAAGRLGEKFESSELGELVWGEPESSFIFTLTEFREIDLDIEPVNEIFGYKPGNIPMGFNRPSDTATSNLLQKFNSVEEAYQELTSESAQDQNGSSDTDHDESTTESTREHTEIQWELIQLGLDHGYDVYVAKNDQNREYEGNKLGDPCIDSLNLTGFSESAMNIIEYVDVIWLDDDYIVEMFEVESTTSVFSGILRMTDFVVKVPNLEVSMNIVAPAADEEKVRKQMARPTFERILDQLETGSLNYISSEEVRELRKIVEENGPLRSPF